MKYTINPQAGFSRLAAMDCFSAKTNFAKQSYVVAKRSLTVYEAFIEKI